MRNYKKIAIVALISVLAIPAAAKAYEFFWLTRFQVAQYLPLFNQNGTVLPYTVYVIPDKNTDKTCLIVLVDNATKQFEMASVDKSSCHQSAVIVD